MVRRFAALASLILSAATIACAAPLPDRVTEGELRARIAVLADDGFGGRKPGTEGGRRTEAYVADAFARAGLSPGVAGKWRQRVDLVTMEPADATLAGGDGAAARDLLVLFGPEDALRLAGMPVGFDERATGRLARAVMLVPFDPKARSWPALDARIAPLAARGAAAVIFVVADADWIRTRNDFAAGRTVRAAAPLPVAVGAIQASAAARLFPDRTSATATLTVRTKVTRFSADNVVGRVKGSDPPAGAVVLSAHWDHLGLCRPVGATDRICNGANDNASGTAMLIEVARRVAAGPRPVRDIWFVATTAEEMGLLGARAFAAAPPVPLSLSRIVAALNIDTAAAAPAGMPAAMIGRGRTPALDAALDAAIVAAGRTVDRDDDAGPLLERQDGWALAQVGVPAVMVSGSFSDMGLLTAYLRGNYHGPGDDLAHLPTLAGAAEDATLHVALARALADPTRYPTPGN